MKQNINELIVCLHEGNFSCVIANGGRLRTFTQRGVKDLYALVSQNDDFLSGAIVADKVVGKAAAALMAMGCIAELYADVISQPALDLLYNSGVKVTYGELVPIIRNRDNTDWCPLEKATMNLNDLSEINQAISTFLINIEILKQKDLKNIK